MKKSLLLSTLAGLALAASAQAQLIVAFNDATTATTAASTLNADLTSAVLGFGAGLDKPKTQVFTSGVQFGVNGDPQGSAWTLQNAIDNNYYYSLTITPDAGSEVDFDSVVLSTYAQTAAKDFYLFSSVTGFTAADSLGTVAQPGIGAGAPGVANTISLAGAGLDSVSSAIEFRVYFTAATANTFNDSGFKATASGNNFVEVNGTVSAIPEPSSFALMAGALGGIALLRRRRS